MSLMHAKYPNLELLEFKARVMLSKDSEFTEEVDKKRKENKYRSVEFEAIVFSQMWGSTCTGFDVLKDGSPAIGGCAMTKEYTTVMHELLTDSYIVFFGAEPCYKATNANETFFDDLAKRRMASLSEAKKAY